MGAPGSMMGKSSWGQRELEPCHQWAPRGNPGTAEDAQFDKSKMAGDFRRTRNWEDINAQG